MEEVQQEIIEDFLGLDDWMDRYQLIIDLGEELPPFPDRLKTEQNLIDGCQSRVWLDCEQLPDGRLHFQAESDALIVRGIVALLLRVVDGRRPDELVAADFHFIHDIGLTDHLSPTRSNGLLAMIRQIKNYALAFSVAR